MMAERGLSLSCFKEQFDDQLTCGVCLDQYTNPKTLSCHHSFCLKCIERIPVEIKDGKYYISCPTCRVDHLLPQGGANSLPNAFHINSMLDLRKTLVSTKKATSTQSTCPKHNDPLKVYCETCCQVICRDCTISTEHNKHTFYLISECYPKHHQQILGNLDLVKQKLDEIDSAVTHLDYTKEELFKKGENAKEQINAHAQQLIDNIQRSRTHLTQQVDTIVQLKTQTLTTQGQQAQKLHTQLKTCQDMIEQSLKEWDQQQILAQKEAMMNEMKKATQHVDPAAFRRVDNPNIRYLKNKKEMGSIITTVSSSDAYIKGTIEVSPCFLKQPSTAILTLHSQNGSPVSLSPSLISSTLSSPGNKHSVKCPITQIQPGKYNITFTPSTGNDQLIVQVSDDNALVQVHIPDSPFTLPVILTPKMRGKQIGGLKNPRGIAVCDNGDIVVAQQGDRTHCISILNKKGAKSLFGTTGKTNDDQFISPRGVAVSKDGYILVTDNHRLQKLTTDGVCVKSVGSRESGFGKLQFHYPMGIAVHPTTGQIFVADSLNTRIQVFKNELTFSHTIDLTISPVKFNCPHDIAIDKEGYLYVTITNQSTCNRHILKLISEIQSSYAGSANRLPVQPFCPSSLTTGCPYQLLSASYLTIHNNLLYVCANDTPRVLILDTDGGLHHQFGGEHALNRGGMTMDAMGNLYVSDSSNNRIIVY